MHVQRVLGVYYATMRSKDGGGWVGRGATFGSAIGNCLKAATGLRRLFVACECGCTRRIPIKT